MRLQHLKHSAAALLLLVTGYVLGASGVLHSDLQAQNQNQTEPAEEDLGLSEQAVKACKAAFVATNSAMVTLEQEKNYVPAIKGVNSFAVTVGGIDAITDLETGRGVDPETFAGLYSGRALEHVAQHLTRDGEGRYLYKNKLVRMYPISQLRQLFEKREKIAATE